MPHKDHEAFIRGINEKRRVDLQFYSKDDGGVLLRRCAPMDYGPSRRAHSKEDRYHFWDYESDTGNHTLSLLPEQVLQIQVTDQPLDPADFVTWSTQDSPWFYPRQWGPRYS